MKLDRRPTALLLLGLLALSLACGKYGPPERTPSSRSSAPATADSDDERERNGP